MYKYQGDDLGQAVMDFWLQHNGVAIGAGAIKPGGREMPETGVAAHQQAAIPTGSETHGGEDVALYANGPGAQNVRGVMEQNLIYDVIRKAFGWAD